MKVRALLILLAITLILLIASDAIAADVGVYFDLGATQTTYTATPFLQFEFYVLARGLGPTQGFELNVEIGSPEFTVLSRSFAGQPCMICLPDEDYIHVLASCTAEPYSPFVLAQFTLGYYGALPMPEDVTLCVRPTTWSIYDVPSSFDCDENQLPLTYGRRDTCGTYPDGCAVLNPSDGNANWVVETRRESLGTLKARW